MSEELILIGEWNGDYVSIVAALVQVSPDLRIRVSNRKLIVKHVETGFYSCFTSGSKVRVPVIKATEDEEVSTTDRAIQDFA